jgi:hypothetical protein
MTAEGEVFIPQRPIGVSFSCKLIEDLHGLCLTQRKNKTKPNQTINMTSSTSALASAYISVRIHHHHIKIQEERHGQRLKKFPRD